MKGFSSFCLGTAVAGRAEETQMKEKDRESVEWANDTEKEREEVCLCGREREREKEKR